MNAERRALLTALFLLALAASALHLAAHPMLVPDKAHPGATLFRGSFVSAALLPLVDLVLVTWLFTSRRTAALGYLINGLIVIYGSVLMGHFAIVSLTDLATKPATFVEYFFKSMSLDIAIAWADFFVGKALYESWRSSEATSRLAPSDAPR
ncbi:MAG: hypothetical protein HZB55_15455 [Deltaproteobacteria bacterium]|nr:hypothetical protein [Deltaproteobacteria bacterium]